MQSCLRGNTFARTQVLCTFGESVTLGPAPKYKLLTANKANPQPSSIPIGIMAEHGCPPIKLFLLEKNGLGIVGTAKKGSPPQRPPARPLVHCRCALGGVTHIAHQLRVPLLSGLQAKPKWVQGHR